MFLERRQCKYNTLFVDNEIFHVRPSKINIAPTNSAMFEFSFTPPEDHRFYSTSLTVQAYWIDPNYEPDEWEVPISSKVTLTGFFKSFSPLLSFHPIFLGFSYPEGDVIVPRVEIRNSEIIFPPCLPGMKVYANFKIINLGCTPVIFKLIPPRTR